MSKRRMFISGNTSKGFTLVELAIVITIIGLLIGGVLKGQELLENARMTSSASKLKGLTAATVTFRDIYKALPGDMITPGNFLQNCTTAPCNTSGDANGVIGADNSIYGNENTQYWMHLAKAGLISGVDPNSTWSGVNYFLASFPAFDMGGMITIWHANMAVSTTYPTGLTNHQFFPLIASGGAAVLPVLRHNLIAKFDLKTDDGKPYSGDVGIYDHAVCARANNVPYDPNESKACYMIVEAGF